MKPPNTSIASAPTAIAEPVISERRRLRRMLRKAILNSITAISSGLVRNQHAVADGEGLLGMRHELRIVRGEDEGGAQLRLHAAHQRDDRGAGGAVEIGGRLVRQHDGRLLHQRARDRDALLLAAGQFVRPLSALRRQPDRLQHRQRAAARSAAGMPTSSSGYSTFS